MAKYALCIGINNYPGTQNDLSGCVNDAEVWAEELTSRGFVVTTLLDGKATKAAMVEGMQTVIGKAKYGDAVVITYSGHGTWVADEDGDEPDKRDEALCPHDLGSGPLIDDQLYEIFAERERGVRLVVVADSCHSGTVARFYREAAEPRRVRFLAPEDYPQNKDKLKHLRLIERAPARGRSRGGALLLAGCQNPPLDTERHGRVSLRSRNAKQRGHQLGNGPWAAHPGGFKGCARSSDNVGKSTLGASEVPNARSE